MSIYFDESARVFHLRSASWSWVFRIGMWGTLEHLGWGPALERWDGGNAPRPVDRAFSPNPHGADRTCSPDAMAQEYPTAHGADFRSPALAVRHQDGSRQAELAYARHRILEGKPGLEGLPASYAETASEARTLEIDMVDAPSGLVVTLSWTVFADWDIMTRSVRVHNGGTQPVHLDRVLSASLDLGDRNWDMIQLPGAWARERFATRSPLGFGTRTFGSRRGASSHQHNPFICLARP